MLKGKPADKKRETKIEIAADIFCVSVSKAKKIIENRAIGPLPNKILPIRLPDLDVSTVERVGTDLMRIELERGRIFFGHRSEYKEYLLYHLFKKVIPDMVSADSYKLALDIQRRYIVSSLPHHIKEGGVLIEGGCYTGLKALSWYDQLNENCRIIAVEIGKPNVEILKMNIEANSATEKIVPVHAGLWREDGTQEQYHSFTTRRFLQETDRWKEHMNFVEKVPTITIDSLLDQNEVEVADYMNIQVNGAEIEVLKGFKDLSRIKILGVAAYYSKDGIKNVDIVREMMTERGCQVINESPAGRITFSTPKWKGIY